MRSWNAPASVGSVTTDVQTLQAGNAGQQIPVSGMQAVRIERRVAHRDHDMTEWAVAARLRNIGARTCARRSRAGSERRSNSLKAPREIASAAPGARRRGRSQRRARARRAQVARRCPRPSGSGAACRRSAASPTTRAGRSRNGGSHPASRAVRHATPSSTSRSASRQHGPIERQPLRQDAPTSSRGVRRSGSSAARWCTVIRRSTLRIR